MSTTLFLSVYHFFIHNFWILWIIIYTCTCCKGVFLVHVQISHSDIVVIIAFVSAVNLIMVVSLVMVMIIIIGVVLPSMGRKLYTPTCTTYNIIFIIGINDLVGLGMRLPSSMNFCATILDASLSITCTVTWLVHLHCNIYS